MFFEKFFEQRNHLQFDLLGQCIFHLESLRMVVTLDRFAQPFAVGFIRVRLGDERNDIPHMGIERKLLFLRNQCHAILIPLLFGTPVIRIDRKFACRLNVFLAVAQPKIDRRKRICVVLLCCFPYECRNLHFAGCCLHCKDSICSQIVPVYPKIILTCFKVI